ncbi:MAG: toll/interleukin-1 receptor domain-containing protein [Mesorhizobium sp.]|uniref:toll/interleukin-1 receptor domain-containing protein n=1 Tax=Mesorhizobium sp. TaxID=1871066 RepID=UPI0011F5E78D|nr:toll/interleukin-1 receptor domain-containing protein [Mesorhizobium sp.]TIP29591.1 MAG: toll/interleukin-1 receptor domain-containing protein [Mesorhizobium sp.]
MMGVARNSVFFKEFRLWCIVYWNFADNHRNPDQSGWAWGPKMSRIFVSHSSRDGPRAVEVRDWLVANGWDDVFLDLDPVRGLAPGERWQNALRAAADRCEAVVFLISLDWLNSRWCLSEYLLAKQLGKRLFPVIIDDVEISALPADMAADHQAVDLVLDVQGWERLKQGLNGRVLMPKASAFRPADGHIRDSNL